MSGDFVVTLARLLRRTPQPRTDQAWEAGTSDPDTRIRRRHYEERLPEFRRFVRVAEATGALRPRTWEATRIRLTAKRRYLVTDWEIAEFLEAEWRAAEDAGAASWREQGPLA
jgi:hypothetical protein